jgi:hypothetical protein
MPRRIAWRLLGAALLASAALPAHAADGVQSYDVPRALLYNSHDDAFTVRVRSPGGPWHDLFEYKIQVDMDTQQTASLVYFDFTGTVEIEIEKNNGHFTTASILPADAPIAVTRRDDVVRLTLNRPERFSVQFDDDRLHNLHILAGPPPSPAPADDGHLVSFGPGIHLPPAGSDRFPVRSGDRIHLAGGAVLRGSFALDGVHDVRISGRGLLYNPGAPIDLNHASDVDIRDLIIVNDGTKEAARVMNIRNAERVSVRDISGFTSGKWSDGLNISTSRHVTVDGGYLRVSDDAVVVYAVTDCPICRDHPIAPVGPPGATAPADTFDIHFRNLTIWNDVAHALFVGHFGNNAAPRTIHYVSFEKIHIVNLDEDDPAWEGAMALFSGDSTLIRDVTFSDISVDRIEEGKLFNIVTGLNGQYNKQPGRGIDGVTFRNIAFNGRGLPSRSIIRGFSDASQVRNVRIEGLNIAGRPVTSLAQAPIDVGAHVSGLSIR